MKPRAGPTRIALAVGDALERPRPVDATGPHLGGLDLAFGSSCEFAALSSVTCLLETTSGHALELAASTSLHLITCGRARGTSVASGCISFSGDHHQVRKFIAPRRLELELRLPGGVELHAATCSVGCASYARNKPPHSAARCWLHAG